MGLDMYLNARKYLSKHNDSDVLIAEHIAKVLPRGFPRPTDIIVQVMYWRKANAIHRWFVETVQGGRDDCGDYVVDREQLQELVDTISQCIRKKSLAPVLLPTIAGFFFGGTDYDEYFWDDLRTTRTWLKKILKDPAFNGWEFYYSSSW
jgi:hypothetical protein